MSNIQRVKQLVGLSDTDIDPALNKDEIDHDFFDNPSECSVSSYERNQMSEKRAKDDPWMDSELTRSHKTPRDNCFKTDFGEFSKSEFNTFDETNSAKNESDPDSTSNSMGKKADQSPETYASSTNRAFASIYLNQKQLFSTGTLLECLPQSEVMKVSEAIAIGPMSSDARRAFETYQGSEDSDDEELLLHEGLQNLSQTHQGRPTTRVKLFDLSSSSSDNSESDKSDDGSLDTDDEEFVDLLEKYYDYIDLGQSDFSDITEVSPMSSLAASPLPPFSEMTLNESATTAIATITDTSKEAFTHHSPMTLTVRENIFRGTSHHSIFKPKPLLPLIINTVEDIPIVSECGGRTAWSTYEGDLFKFSKSQDCNELSLLMKVEQCPVNNHFGTEIITQNLYQGSGSSSILSEFQPTSASSSSSIPSRTSLTGTTFSNGQGRSELSSGTYLSHGHKRPSKNHSFTPDQMRRIEKDNSVLLKKILDTHKSHGHHHCRGSIHHHRQGIHQALRSSASISRQRQQKRIDHENLMLIRRLQSVKPSKEIIEAFRKSANLKCP